MESRTTFNQSPVNATTLQEVTQPNPQTHPQTPHFSEILSTRLLYNRDATGDIHF